MGSVQTPRVPDLGETDREEETGLSRTVDDFLYNIGNLFSELLDAIRQGGVVTVLFVVLIVTAIVITVNLGGEGNGGNGVKPFQNLTFVSDHGYNFTYPRKMVVFETRANTSECNYESGAVNGEIVDKIFVRIRWGLRGEMTFDEARQELYDAIVPWREGIEEANGTLTMVDEEIYYVGEYKVFTIVFNRILEGELPYYVLSTWFYGDRFFIGNISTINDDPVNEFFKYLRGFKCQAAMTDG